MGDGGDVGNVGNVGACVNKGAHRVVVSKLRSKSARNSPISPNTPPLAPTTAVHGSSKLALNRAPVYNSTAC